jgi:hypothetical protein
MDKKEKKPSFKKPELKKVPLLTEEAVLTSCKTGKGQTVGVGFAKCEENLGMGQSTPCSNFGS